MSWWESLPSALEVGASLKEKAETLKAQASEHAETLKAQASEHAEILKSRATIEATKFQERAEKIKEDYVTEEALESVGFNALVGRAPVPGDGEKWERAVKALDLTYVTDRVVAMGMPYDRRSEMIAQAKEQLGAGPAVRRRAGAPSMEKPGNNVDVVSAMLGHKHPGHFMVWNVSEESYDYSKFNDQVLEFKFPGHPAPPLGLLFKICTSMENWLDSDPKNVACMHCLTGKGRTATILACYLTWAGEAGSVMEALHYVAQRRHDDVEKLTIPSQRRYLQYFSNMLDGVKPRSDPLLLRRIIMNTIPKFGTQLGGVRDPTLPKSALDDGSLPPGDPRDLGCCPYVQLFKGGKLVFTAAWQSGSTSSTSSTSSTTSTSTVSEGEGKGAAAEAAAASGGGGGGGFSRDPAGVGADGSNSPKASTGPAWCYPSDSSVAFSVDAVLQGDILVRCRHLTSKGVRVSMFRAAFHTGYVPCGVLRLNKAQLDGACTDDRFDDDFFIDLIFAPVTSRPSEASSPTSGGSGGDRSTVDPAEPPSSLDAPDAAATALSAEVEGEEAGTTLTSLSAPETVNTAAARRERGMVVEPEARDAYDEMLHRDGRFWDEIAARKERAAARRAAKASSGVGGVGGFAGCQGGSGGGGTAGGGGASIGGVGAGAFGFDDEDHVNDDDDDVDDDGVAIEFDLPGGGMAYRKSPMPAAVAADADDAARQGSAVGSGSVSEALDFISTLSGDSTSSAEDAAGGNKSNTLLDQLAAVDADDDEGIFGGGGDADSWVDAQPSPPTPTSETSMATAPTEDTPTALVAPVSAELDAELLALEELEKELAGGGDGDEVLSSSSSLPTGAETTTVPSVSLADDLDDLEDFEGYLASLTTPKN